MSLSKIIMNTMSCLSFSLRQTNTCDCISQMILFLTFDNEPFSATCLSKFRLPVTSSKLRDRYKKMSNGTTKADKKVIQQQKVECTYR